jgi:hypothetical protein
MRFTGAEAIADEERDPVPHFERKRFDPVAIGMVFLYFLLSEGHGDRCGERDSDCKPGLLVL